jgi:putative flippase GtrA
MKKLYALYDAIVSRKQFRYLISGAASEAIEYVSFLLLLSLTDMLYVSNSISFILGVVSGFIFHTTWSFPGEHHFKARHQFAGYASLAVVNFFVINAAVGYLVYGLHLKPALAKLIAIAVAAIWGYVFSNYIFFRRKSS